MRRRIPFIASLLCLLMLLSLLPAAVFAEDGEIDIVEEITDDTLISEEELDGELVVLPDAPDGWQVPEEELRPFYGRTGWLQLALNRPLLEQVGHQRGGVACACYALAYCRTLLDGRAQPYSDFNLGTNENDAWCAWYYGDYESLNFAEAYEVYERIVEELLDGKPVVILVNGTRTQQHYVTIVGFEQVKPGQPLTAHNFLMLDPCAADFEPQNLGEADLDLKKLGHGVYQLVVDRSEAELPREMHRSSYLSACSLTPCARKLRTTRSTLLRALPCGARVDADSRRIDTLELDEIFLTDAIVKNTRGEYWYRGRTEDGRTGYVFAAACSEGRPQYTVLKLGDTPLPLCLTEGEPFVLSGTLSAGGNELRSVTVEVFAGDEPQGEPLLRGTLTGRRLACLLEDGALKEALPFETLSEGDYCLRICASVAACSSTDGENLLWEEQSLELLTLGFAVEAGPEVDELS